MSKNIKNRAAQSSATPVLSVLIPYYRDDPAQLLTDLLAQIDKAKPVEILLYDDGTGDEDVNKRLTQIANKAPTPVSLYLAKTNKGRAAARNHLQQNARADWVLFLDADMRPQEDSFLEGYLAEINTGGADILFGGFTVPLTKLSPDTELHRAFSQGSDCLSARERTKAGPQYVCSSNLCVRADVLTEEPFDTGFTGWGWEDSEWAARVAKSYKLKHVDIPALHLGLESTETLLTRFKDSGPNYFRFTNAHPELAKTLSLYKHSQRLRRVPGQKLMRPFLAFLVRASYVPTKLRILALKLWRASWYAGAVS